MEENIDKKLLVSYADHPAFKAVASGEIENGFEGMEIFTSIDSSFQNFLSDKGHRTSKEIDAFFDEMVAPQTQRLSSLISDRMDDGDLFKKTALASVTNFFEILKEEAFFRNDGKLYKRLRNPSEEHQRMISELDEEGFFLRTLDKTKLRQFWDDLKEYRAKLENTRDKMKPQGQASCMISLPQEGKLWRDFRDLLSGIPEAVNDYSKHPMDFDYYALQLSHVHEQWWKNCYEDVALPTSKTVGMHLDEDYALLKGIVYLQPVDQNNSPFSVVPGNCRYMTSYSREVFLKRLDVNIATVWKSDPEAIFPYYRKQFKLRKYRKEFIKLPSVIRGTSHFGDDVVDGSDLSNWLLKTERKITSDAGNCMVFTGGRIFHRGGMVEKGERWAIQIGFRQRDQSWVGLKNRAKRKALSVLPTSALATYRKVKNMVHKGKRTRS